MTDEIELNKIRKRAMDAYMSDGIWELFLGFMLLVVGVMKLHEHRTGEELFVPGVVSIIIVFGIILVRKVKKKITFPRIGYVDVSHSDRGSRLVHTLITLLVVFFFAALLLALNSSRVTGWLHIQPLDSSDWFDRYISLIFAVFTAIIISTLAILRSAPRMHVASALFILVFLVLHIMKIYSGYGFVITGSLLLIAGLVTMTWFIRNNPVLPEEEFKGQQIND